MLIYKENTKVMIPNNAVLQEAIVQISIVSNIYVSPTIQDIFLDKYIKTQVSSTLEFTDWGFF